MNATRVVPASEKKLWQYINLKLAALGYPPEQGLFGRNGAAKFPA